MSKIPRKLAQPRRKEANNPAVKWAKDPRYSNSPQVHEKVLNIANQENAN